MQNPYFPSEEVASVESVGPVPLVTDPVLTPIHLLPKIVKAGGGECLELRGETRRILFDARDTGGQVALSHTSMHSGMATPLHVHTREDEMFLVTAGRFSFQVGSETFEVRPGDFVFAPRHIAHAYRCISESAGKMFIWVQSAGFEDFFRAQALATELTPAIMTEMATQFGVRLGSDTTGLVSTAKPRVMRAGEENWIKAFGDQAHYLVPTSEVKGQYAVVLAETPSLAGPPMHVHERCDEMFVILEGRYEFCLGDARIQVGAGDAIFAPRGIPHSFRVISSENGRFVVVALPGDFETFFHECAELFAMGHAPDVLMPQIVEVATRYGITFLQQSS